MAGVDTMCHLVTNKHDERGAICLGSFLPDNNLHMAWLDLGTTTWSLMAQQMPTHERMEGFGEEPNADFFTFLSRHDDSLFSCKEQNLYLHED